MSAICQKCGRDCRTALALSKHEAKCCPTETQQEPDLEYIFYDRHEQKAAKCPVCKEIWSDFLVVDPMKWVCLKCGCYFIPTEKLKEINDWRASNPIKWRIQTQDRICGQTEAPDEAKGVSEDPPPEKTS